MSTAMDNTTALTAKRRSVGIDGATLVYRRLGNGLASDREVIVLDNRVVGASTAHRFGRS